MTRMRLWMAGVNLAALAGAAQAQEAVATAPATAPPAADPATAAQIEHFIRASPMPSLPDDGVDGVTPGEDPREAHGEVTVGVGSGGYRSVSAMSVIPVGAGGTVAVGVSKSRNSPYGPFGAYGGPAFPAYGDGARCSRPMARGPDWRGRGEGPGERACAPEAIDLAR